MPNTETPTLVEIASGPLVGPVLRRVVGMFAARVDLPLDRLDDAVLVADAVAEHAPAYVIDSTLGVALSVTDDVLAIRVGPLLDGGANSLVQDAALADLGNLIERLTDDISVHSDDAGEYLVARLAFGLELVD